MGCNDRRKYQSSVLKERGQHGIREKTKLTLDTQVNLAGSDKFSFYNQKEWLEEYEHGKGMFDSEYSQKQPRMVFCEKRCS